MRIFYVLILIIMTTFALDAFVEATNSSLYAQFTPKKKYRPLPTKGRPHSLQPFCPNCKTVDDTTFNVCMGCLPTDDDCADNAFDLDSILRDFCDDLATTAKDNCVKNSPSFCYY